MADIIEAEIPYKSDLFVNRKNHLDWVSSLIQKIQSKGTPESLIVNIWGVRGIGKSWFTAHLKENYKFSGSLPDEMPLDPTFSLFYQFTDEIIDTINYKELGNALIEQIREQLNTVLTTQERAALKQAENDNSIDLLVRLLCTLTEKFVPVILLDQTELVFDNWTELEKTFIEPLVVTNRILFVIAGRRPVPEWMRFEVRRRVAPLELSRLDGFSSDDISNQLTRLIGQPIESGEIYRWSATSPLIAKALLEESKKQLGGFPITVDALQQHKLEFLPTVLESAIEYLFTGISPKLIEVLKAVSALRYYRLEGVQHMLTLRGREELPYNYYLRLIRSLEQNTEYVWWNRERRAYTTSRIVRSLLNQQQMLTDADLFIQQHQQAIEMYEGWVGEYPEASEDFILEIWFHQANIYIMQEDIKTLGRKLEEKLDFALENLSFDRANTLLNQLRSDVELQDLLPESMLSDLNNKLVDALEESRESPIAT